MNLRIVAMSFRYFRQFIYGEKITFLSISNTDVGDELADLSDLTCALDKHILLKQAKHFFIKLSQQRSYCLMWL